MKVGRLFAPGIEGLGRWQSLPLALVCIALIVVLRVADPPFLQQLRLWQFDALQIAEPRALTNAPAIIVDIDEHSLSRYGQWPWPRSRIAMLVDRITQAGPLVIGIDILFAEADRMSPAKFAETVDELSPDLKAAIAALPSNDARLGDAIGRGRVVLGVSGVVTVDGKPNIEGLWRAPVRMVGGDPRPFLSRFDAVIQSIDEISSRAAGIGAYTVPTERDGIVRRLPLAVTIGGEIVPSLAVETLRVGLGVGSYAIHSGPDGVTGVSIGNTMFPTDANGRVWLHFTPHDVRRFVSAADLLDGALDPALLKNRIVLIGVSGIGLVDMPATPLDSLVPGVEIHAQLIESLFAGVHLTRPEAAFWIDLALILAGAAIIVGVVPLLRPLWSPLPLLVVLTSLGALIWFGFTIEGWLIDGALPALSSLALFSIALGSNLAATEYLRQSLQADLALERAAAQRMEGELSAARDIQMGILPRDFPAYPERAEFDLHAELISAKAVGGDLFDYAMIDDDRLFFMVGDVSGKGIPASLFMAITKVLYKSRLLRRRSDIGRIMTEVNVEVSRENPAMLFVTVLAGILDLHTGEVEWCNAGHDAPFRLGKDGRLEAIELVGGPPLCMLEDFEYETERSTVAPGDVLLLYTDGVSEATNPENQLFTSQRIADYLRALPDVAMKTLVDGLVEAVLDFTGAAEQFDDITLLAVRYAGPQAARTNEP